MSSGKIIENFQIKVNDLLDYNTFEVKLTSNPLVSSSLGIKTDLENIFSKIYEIHWLLKANSQLSNNERLDYCKVERILMIKYLKKLVDKF
ncbi:MAG: hypothetical protein ACFFFB_08090 [Candidatus Heimdallarchaeota archaeon]